ncbi:MAG TPA: TetR/AcrR family transcriptional regulator [bacterium]|nr:TetR/AcrR family transcriptional regulator [bacterium]
MSKGESTRERIVSRALRWASRDGLTGLSIGGLAQDLGLSKSGLFAHFGSKEELQVEVLQAAASRFVDQVVRDAIRAPRGRPRVERMFENWLRWSSLPELPGGCPMVAASTELDDHEGRARDELAGMEMQKLATLAKAARLAVAEGHFRPDLDCEQFAFEEIGILLAFHQAQRLHRHPQAEARARAAFSRLLADAQAAA